MLHKSGDYSRAEQRHSVTLSRFRTSDVVSVVSKPGPIILPVMWRPPQHRDIVTLCPCHQGEGCSKHGRLKTEVWTNTTHNCLLRPVSVGNAGTDTREEFAKTAVNLSIFSILSYECQKLLPPSLYCVLRINGSIAFLPVQSWLTFIICYCFPRYCYTSRTSGHKKWSGTFGPNYLLVESRAKNK